MRRPTVRFPARDARCYHLVFGDQRLDEWAWLDPTELAARTGLWFADRADRRVVALVTQLVDRGEAVVLEALDRPPGPALPPVTAPIELDDVTERLERATRVLRVDARNPPAPGVGFPGLWSALAVAGAAAAGSDGVWFDAGALRVRTTASSPVAASGRVRVGEHLLLTQAPTASGELALATKGLGAFGLPELLVDDVPGTLSSIAALVLQGLGQRLVDGLLDELRGTTRNRLSELPSELIVTGAHVARAVSGARPRESGAARLRLVHRPPTDDGGDDHLAVEPAGADARRTRADWMRVVLADLVAPHTP